MPHQGDSNLCVLRRSLLKMFVENDVIQVLSCCYFIGTLAIYRCQ